MSDMKHVAFFGDGEKTFALTPVEIIELERVTGAGIGALCQKVFAGYFAHKDLIETIRLGLIGGGTSPKDAAALVAAYAVARPLAETQPLAVSILEVLWTGKVQGDEKKDATDE